MCATFLKSIYQQKSSLRTTSSGFSLPAALFIIVILGLLAIALFRMTQTSEVAVAQEILSIRGFYAAESGLQTAAMSAFPVSGGAGTCSNFTLNFSTSGLSNCSATVTCTSYISDGTNFFNITSTGQCSSGELQSSRTLEALLRGL
ncbi:MAG: hypothetical protein HWE27_18330 [Gammaproteobacteria bacterium]|nr:hypothetical protein [Gammaproteobacteria bacterium]